jgi:hypothetical protein
LLGVFALSFLVLLLAKVLSHKAEDRTAKQLLILLLCGTRCRRRAVSQLRRDARADRDRR